LPQDSSSPSEHQRVPRSFAAKAGPPIREGWLAKATGPAKFLDGHARVSRFEEANDLLICKSGLFHSRYSPKLADFIASLWYCRGGQVTLISSTFDHQYIYHLQKLLIILQLFLF
jgi:hypothetical protein